MIQKHHIENLRSALQLFDEIADMPNMAFGFRKSGCGEAAHIIGHMMMKKQLHVGKIWAIDSKKGLDVLRPDKVFSKWWYHVAPIVGVEMPSGQIEQLIFDPGLFDGPAEIHEWVKVMHAQNAQVETLRWRQSPKGYKGNYTPDERITAATIFNARAQLREFENDKETQKLRAVFKSNARKAVMAEQNRATNDNDVVFKRHGETWRAGNFRKNDLQKYLVAKNMMFGHRTLG